MSRPPPQALCCAGLGYTGERREWARAHPEERRRRFLAPGAPGPGGQAAGLGAGRPRADPAAAPAGLREPLASPGSGPEEHTLLQDELSRLEDLLAQAGAERDELAGRYHTVNERVSAQGAWQPALG